MDHLQFSKNLIKGRVAEMIFEQMLREAGGFTILDFGYEKVLPELAHRQNSIEAEKTMEIIRRAPDFAIIKHSTNKVYLIEVKYMHECNRKYVLQAAQQMVASWEPAYLFIATPTSFFFEPAMKVVENNGQIEPLGFDTIDKKVQEQYIELLNSFIEK